MVLKANQQHESCLLASLVCLFVCLFNSETRVGNPESGGDLFVFGHACGLWDLSSLI